MFLIVDDELDVCWALESLLNAKGIQTGRALTAEQALVLMDQYRVEVAFLDAKIPDMEGLELAMLIRQKDPHVRIVMVSGFFYRDDAAIQKALAGGVIDGFIGKPFRHDDILRAAGLASETIPSH